MPLFNLFLIPFDQPMGKNTFLKLLAMLMPMETQLTQN
jgi:hypothetical protein